MNRWEMEKKIAINALKDPSFKKKLHLHPKEALAGLFKNEIDPSYLDRLHIKIEEEKKNEWIITLPHIEEKTENLSEEELEKIAGAGGCCAFSACITTM